MNSRSLLAAALVLVACDEVDEGGGGGVGGKIAFERDNNVWIANDDGTGEKQLSSEGNARTPALSADGLKVVYEHAGTELLVVSTAGGTATPLTTAASGEALKNPFWAGDTIVFELKPSGANERVKRVPAGGGAVTDLTEGRLPTLNKAANTVLLLVGSVSNPSIATFSAAGGGSPATLTGGSPNQPKRAVFSPDGTKIAYAADVSGKFKVFIADASGANAKQISGTQGNEDWPVFSPEGSLLAFTSDEGGQVTIYQVPVDGSKPFEVFLVGKTPSWGP